MRKRIDDNQKLIVRALNAYGALWISTSGDPSIGFDGLVAYRGQLVACEIKNPKVDKTHQRLTEREKARHEELFKQSVTVWTIKTPGDVTVLIEYMRKPSNRI